MRNASSHTKFVGRAEYSTQMISFAANGRAIRVEKRKIQFMKVTTEYLAITGLKIPRYREKHKLLRMMRIAPTALVCTTVLLECILLIMR